MLSGGVAELEGLNHNTDVWLQEVAGLDANVPFEFWMTASTTIGESPPTRIEGMKPSSQGEAKSLITFKVQVSKGFLLFHSIEQYNL